jgi:ABC-type transport system involved in multi-copper enzyme maturation permease subunit
VFGHAVGCGWYDRGMQAAYLWLWRLLPGNPMVVRIVQGGSRQARHLWVRMGYLGALILLMLIGLLSGGGMGGEVSLTALAKSGAWVFTVISRGQVILVCLLAPLFMAGAIGQERAGQTYNILLTTPLSNLQIVLGSLVGRLFFILALLLSGLPLYAVLLIFGGVPVWSVVVSFSVAACTALLVGTVAVTLSAMRAGGRKAVFSFVIAVAAYLVGAYLLDTTLLRKLGTPDTTTWLTGLHPLLVLEASLDSANYGPPAPETLADSPGFIRFYLSRPFAAFVSICVLLSFIQVIFCAVVLRNIGQGEWRLVRWVKAQLRIPLASGGERRRPAREVWANPIAWREAATRGRGVSGVIARTGFAVVGLMFGAALIFLYHVDMLPKLPGTAPAEVFHRVLFALLLLEVAVITLVALYMSAGSVSREREDGTLDLLLTTPTTPRQYVWGKLRGLVSFLSLLLAVPILTVAMVSVYSLIGYASGWQQATFRVATMNAMGGQFVRHPLLMLPEASVLLAFMLVPFVALCVMIGMQRSVKAKGVLGAVISSVLMVGTLALIFGVCGASVVEKIAYVGPVLNGLSPATNLLMIVNPWDAVAGFIEQPIGGRVSLAVAALVATGVYVAIVYAMLQSMVKNFDHSVRKLSGTG